MDGRRRLSWGVAGFDGLIQNCSSAWFMSPVIRSLVLRRKRSEPTRRVGSLDFKIEKKVPWFKNYNLDVIRGWPSGDLCNFVLISTSIFVVFIHSNDVLANDFVRFRTLRWHHIIIKTHQIYDSQTQLTKLCKHHLRKNLPLPDEIFPRNVPLSSSSWNYFMTHKL